jgi:hypothetical protein
LGSTVRSLAVLPSGDLIAGGQFTTAAGVNANRVARWNDNAWSPLGTGVNGTVSALAVLPNGDVVAGGSFTTAGGVSANRIARWNGTVWSPIGTGMSGSVKSLAVLPNGDLIAGGSFSSAGGRSTNNIARWNGTVWSPLGTGLSSLAGLDVSVEALAVLPNGDLVAGGFFTTAGGVSASRIARWNGTAWSPLGTGLNGVGPNPVTVFALAVMPNGDLIAGGNFITAGGVSADRIARWNGTAWSPLGTGVSGVIPGVSHGVYALSVLPSGDLVAAGTFVTAGGVSTNNIARWNGTAWSPMGMGVAGPNDPPTFAYALALRPNGELVAGGNFITAGPHSCAYVARWTETNIPVIAHQPQPQALDAGQTLTLTSTPANGYASVSVQWRRNGVPISSGPGGASPGGGTVTGASGPLRSPTLLSTATLSITNAQASDSGDYTAIFSNACGEVASTIATVEVVPPPNPCNYDFNQDENVDLTDAQQMAQVFVGLLTPEADWLNGDLNGDENADLTDAQLLAAFVVTGTCGV